MAKKKLSNVVNLSEIKEVAKKAIQKAKTNSKIEVWPKVEKGTHLTVYTYEDGSTKLEWDDDQLLKEVREAIASVENKPKKVARTKKKV
jgi:hypothetical protein